MALFERSVELNRVELSLRRFPVVGLVGPRQVGKTTLARMLRERHPGPPILDLERPADRARLEDVELALGGLEGLVILDEVQRLPALFPALRVLVDRPEARARFLVTGSASPELLQLGSESLAGRIEWLELSGFGLDEVGPASLERLWLRGGFPRSFLAESDADAAAWRRAWIAAVLHRDLPALGVRVSPVALERAFAMLAWRHGQLWHAAELARSLAISEPTARRYLDVLTETFLVRQLRPYFANIEKRQVKAPKVWVRDSGLLHSLLDVEHIGQLERTPLVGASWEGFVIEQILRATGARGDQAWFWATHGGAELDLLITAGGARLGFEVKRTTAPTLTRSMHTALADLGLDHLWVVHAGGERWEMAPHVTALPARSVPSELAGLRTGAS